MATHHPAAGDAEVPAVSALTPDPEPPVVEDPEDLVPDDVELADEEPEPDSRATPDPPPES
jgi:hypothetical protein